MRLKMGKILSSLALVMSCWSPSRASMSRASTQNATESSQEKKPNGSSSTPVNTQAATVSEDVIYTNFIRLLTLDHKLVQQRMHDAHQDPDAVDEGRIQRAAIGVTKEQFQFILDTVVVANDRLGANDAQTRKAAAAWHQRNAANFPKADPDPDLVRLSSEYAAILHQTIATLRQGLGEAAFPRFDAWVKLHWGGVVVGSEPTK